MKLNPGLPWQNLHSTRKKTLFSSKLDLDLRKRLINAIFGTNLCMAVELGHRKLYQKY
jgi:hypothetical protein